MENIFQKIEKEVKFTLGKQTFPWFPQVFFFFLKKLKFPPKKSLSEIC